MTKTRRWLQDRINEALLKQCDALEAKLRVVQAARENAGGARIAHLGAEAVTKIAQE